MSMTPPPPHTSPSQALHSSCRVGVRCKLRVPVVTWVYAGGRHCMAQLLGAWDDVQRTVRSPSLLLQPSLLPMGAGRELLPAGLGC